MTKNILINGNMGYIGPPLTKHLMSSKEDYCLHGFDTGYFAHCLTTKDGLPERQLKAQYFGDIRNYPNQIMDGIDAVVHLAAISNDPIGNAYEQVTAEINIEASVEIARAAKAAGVKRFVFASSCSVYGAGPDKACDEKAPLNPVTAYARSKIAMEEALAELADDDFKVTCLRFATACGWSDRLRLDLVLNDFVASAIATGTITILSDGTPWRPLIHVDDMARAIEWAIQSDADTPFLALNTGSDRWNYQIRDLAHAVADIIPGVDVSINQDAMPDKRTYKVDFSKFSELAQGYTPQVSLEDAIRGLQAGLTAVGFKDAEFRASNLMRLNMLNSHQNSGMLNKELFWV
ncbi:NAD-dependent epimerase/dehydratase family protein [Aestuariispira insulae]|uniref:Nucleoside-diphosphate-sugar epimerase n=1 Tax=Aestuariispira insulae TaxID=1461337 RepID=A0A3D9HNE2_9PROT|nr:SDR family oxidoreductase [Aestuariispira insulae]RED50821.1 nucleoside-diphosphate-sugar epimerase [Aestuariispira insulae]